MKSDLLILILSMKALILIYH